MLLLNRVWKLLCREYLFRFLVRRLNDHAWRRYFDELGHNDGREIFDIQDNGRWPRVRDRVPLCKFHNWREISMNYSSWNSSGRSFQRDQRWENYPVICVHHPMESPSSFDRLDKQIHDNPYIYKIYIELLFQNDQRTNECVLPLSRYMIFNTFFTKCM